VLPYTGANLWVPFAAGSGLIGLGVWLRRIAERFREE
jgi:LPXTG-motif cell wall-anchored protein